MCLASTLHLVKGEELYLPHMKERKEQTFVVDVTAKLEEVEHRLSLLENFVQSWSASSRTSCKVCGTDIDSKNTSKKGILAELCDKCWELQDHALEEA